MAEVMLTLVTEPEEARAAFDAAMARRRWVRTPGLSGTWTCYFDAAFPEEIRRVILEDLRQSVAETGTRSWRGMAAVAAIAPFTVTVADAPGAGARAPRHIWMDGDEPLGPLGEVVVTFDHVDRRLAAALPERGWLPLDDLPSTWMHPFDLAMFTPVEALVRDELCAAADDAGLEDWRAVWALATWGHLDLASPTVPKPGPYADWRW